MKIKILTTLLIVTALWLTACTKDDAGQETVVTPSPSGQTLQLESVTRSGSIAATLQNIKVLMAPDDKADTYYEGSFVKTTNGWDHFVSVNVPNYHIYGYMPGDQFSASLSPLPGSANGFQSGAVMTFTDLPAAVSENFCIVTSVKNTKPTDDDPFVLGNYAFENIHNKVSLHLDHLYAGLVFKVALGNNRNYSDLRTIKLDTLKIRTKQVEKAVVTFRQGKQLADGDIAYTFATGKSAECPFYEGGGVLAAPADTVKAMAGYVPQLYDDLELVAVYTVYNKAGKQVRTHTKVANKIPMKSLLSRGQMYTFVVTVEPSYLYQLSDDDLNNPDISIN